MSHTRSLLLYALLLPLAACGFDPAKIAPHALYADDGARVVVPGPVAFAVVGNTAGDVATDDVLASLSARIPGDPPLSFLALLGGMVDTSSNAAWKAFDVSTDGLLTRPGSDAIGSLPAVPVAGAGEGRGDEGYRGLAAAFPGIGADIGLGRVATWYSFDLQSAETTWRIFVLDAAKARLASRWNEQIAWLDEVADGDYDGALVFMHDAPLSLAGPLPSGSPAEAPTELLDTLLADIDDTKVKAVFFAGPSATQVISPEGEYGTLHVGAGGGGSPLVDLWREAPKPPEGEDPLSLESSFDGTLVGALNAWSSAVEIDPKLVDMARGKGDFEGVPRRVSASAVPTWGWWEVQVDGPALALRLHLYQPGGGFAPSWSGRTTLGEPWKTVP